MRHWIAVIGLICAVPAWAAPNTHDGFYLKLQGGLGGTSVRKSNTFLSGGSGAFNLEMGGSLTKNLALFGKVFGAATPNPALTVGGITVRNSAGSAQGNFGALGLGLSYYFMPVNLYLSGALTGTALNLTNLQGTALTETAPGMGIHLGVGKEWWVSSEWGLGVGGELALTSAAGWTGGALLLFFSATYN